MTRILSEVHHHGQSLAIGVPHGWGWINWHINRGRVPLNPSARDLRMISHRRPL